MWLAFCKNVVFGWKNINKLKLSCNSCFQNAFTECCCVFKVSWLAWANQGNYLENANAYAVNALRKRLLQLSLKVRKNRKQTNKMYIKYTIIKYTEQQCDGNILPILHQIKIKQGIVICLRTHLLNKLDQSQIQS